MRIRLRVPKDGEPKSKGVLGWVKNLFGSAAPAPPAAQPVPAAVPIPDKRWIAHANARYYPAGRLCIRQAGNWQSEYLFDVQSPDQSQQIRVVIPESDVAVWEKKHAQRMPEALRARLIRETLHALLDLNRYPSAILVNPLEIENAEL